MTLLRLQEADQVWPLLNINPIRVCGVTCWLVWLSHEADPESLWQRLAVEKDDSTRRALILGLGDFADAKLLSAVHQDTISAELLRLFQEDADPGVHGAAEWTLKKLGQQAELAKIRSALATGELVGERRWYVTK